MVTERESFHRLGGQVLDQRGHQRRARLLGIGESRRDPGPVGGVSVHELVQGQAKGQQCVHAPMPARHAKRIGEHLHRLRAGRGQSAGDRIGAEAVRRRRVEVEPNQRLDEGSRIAAQITHHIAHRVHIGGLADLDDPGQGRDRLPQMHAGRSQIAG